MKCERCKSFGMVCVDRERYFCWDHYREEMAKRREQREPYDAAEKGGQARFEGF